MVSTTEKTFVPRKWNCTSAHWSAAEAHTTRTVSHAVIVAPGSQYWDDVTVGRGSARRRTSGRKRWWSGNDGDQWTCVRKEIQSGYRVIGVKRFGMCGGRNVSGGLCAGMLARAQWEEQGDII